MGLVLFSILFLFGARGMELRRGLSFSTITAVLLIAWVLPIAIQNSQSLGALEVAIAIVGLLMAGTVLSFGSYFAGRAVRAGVATWRGSSNDQP